MGTHKHCQEKGQHSRQCGPPNNKFWPLSVRGAQCADRSNGQETAMGSSPVKTY